LSNAIKFTPRGGHAHITVRSIGGYCDIEVKDTGAGIASDLLPYVFDRFWRADSCAEHRYAGLGLGLALAKRLAELHGGTVTATSPARTRERPSRSWSPAWPRASGSRTRTRHPPWPTRVPRSARMWPPRPI